MVPTKWGFFVCLFEISIFTKVTENLTFTFQSTSKSNIATILDNGSA